MQGFVAHIKEYGFYIIYYRLTPLIYNTVVKIEEYGPVSRGNSLSTLRRSPSYQQSSPRSSPGPGRPALSGPPALRPPHLPPAGSACSPRARPPAFRPWHCCFCGWQAPHILASLLIQGSAKRGGEGFGRCQSFGCWKGQVCLLRAASDSRGRRDVALCW